MNILDKIKRDRLKARIDKDTLTTKVLTTLLGEAQTIDKSKQTLDIVALVKKHIKALDEIIAMGGMNSLAGIVELSVAERKILEEYLPKQLNEKEISAIVSELTDKSMRSVMTHMKADYAGQYDGKVVSGIVKGL